MNVNSWTILAPLAVLVVGVLLALFNHPILGGEIVAVALALLREILKR